MNFNQVQRILPKEDGNLKFCDAASELSTLPKESLRMLKEQRKEILDDLEGKDLTRTDYFDKGEILIFSSKILSKQDENCQKILYIKKDEVKVNFDVIHCDVMMWMAKIILQQDCAKGIKQYDLNSMKSMQIDIPENKFLLVDEINAVGVMLPFIALAHLRAIYNEIKSDFQDENSSEKMYYCDENCEIKRGKFMSFNVLRFQDKNGDFVAIRERSFKKMLKSATGDSLPGDDKEVNKKTGNLTTDKSIDFSDDCQYFKITNEHKESCALPTAALDILLENKEKILFDFDDENRHDEVFNKYWTNDVYSISTGCFSNEFRTVDERVLRFIRVQDNYYIFVIVKETFMKMLDLYQIERKACFQ